MNREAKTEPIGLVTDFGTMAGNAGGIVGPPGFRAAGGDFAAAFRLNELDPAPIRECFLRGVDNLHHMAVGAIAG